MSSLFVPENFTFNASYIIQIISICFVRFCNYCKSSDLKISSTHHQTTVRAVSVHNNLDSMWLKLSYSNTFQSPTDIHTTAAAAAAAVAATATAAATTPTTTATANTTLPNLQCRKPS
jgi:hypothetical protein